MFDLLFLLCFTLHNVEEGLWLPAWSSASGRRFHPPVEADEFRFAVLAITVFGYLLTFAVLAVGDRIPAIEYAYLGFVLSMVVNAIMPHLAATVATRRYAPGTLTGVVLNVPVGLYVVMVLHAKNILDPRLLVSLIVVGGAMLASLKPLFRVGRRLGRMSCIESAPRRPLARVGRRSERGMSGTGDGARQPQ